MIAGGKFVESFSTPEVTVSESEIAELEKPKVKEVKPKDIEGEKPKVSKVDKAAEVTSKAGKITKGASKVDEAAKIASEGDNISKTPRMEKSVYIPKDENGKLISLKKQRLMPLPDKRANAHSNPHQHVFMYDFDNRYWYRSDQEILN